MNKISWCFALFGHSLVFGLVTNETRCPLGQRFRGETNPRWSKAGRMRATTRRGEQVVFCVPQKCGSRNWAGLVFFLQNGRPPISPEESIRSQNSFGHTEVTNQHTVFFIARNPYIRLLSLYLQKVQPQCITGGVGCDRYPKLYHISATFPEFVEVLANKTGGLASNACAWDSHLCSQVSGCGYSLFDTTVLKLEEQASWFPCLAKRLQLSERDLIGEQWNGFSSQPCFYTPDKNCSHMLHASQKQSIVVGPRMALVPLRSRSIITIRRQQSW